MPLNLFPFLIVEAVLISGVLMLLVWRKIVSSKEDDTLHVMDGGSTQQTAVAQKLEVIDKWGKTLTVITVIVGLAVALGYGYQYWVQSGNIPAGV